MSGASGAMSEREIAQALAPVVNGELVVPYPGKWAQPPYESLGGRAVIAADPGLSSIVVEPVKGAVVLVDSSGELAVNRSLEAFVACARAYTAAINAPIAEGDDDAWDEVGGCLIGEFRRIDPGATAEESFWSVAAEEVGYGMSAPGVDLRTARGSAAVAENAKKRLLLAMSDEQRAETFTPDLWRRLSAATQVTVAPALPRLIEALELAAHISAERGEPMPQPEYLLCADAGGELSAAITAGLLERLTGVRLICRLTPTTQSSGGVTRVSGVPVFSFGGENAANQVVSTLASRAGD